MMRSIASVSDSNRQRQLRSMLVALRDETYQRVRELRHEQDEDTDLNPSDEMDRARVSADVETHASLIARAEERLRYIDEALGRVEKGRYGICAGCSTPIPIKRLQAMPFAIYCVQCQQERGSIARGWTDGGTIQPYDQQWTLPEGMEEGADRTSVAVASITMGSSFAEAEEKPKANRWPAKPEASPDGAKPKTSPRKK